MLGHRRFSTGRSDHSHHSSSATQTGGPQRDGVQGAWGLCCCGRVPPKG